MSSGDKTHHGSSNHLEAPSAVPATGSQEAKTMRRSSSQQNMFKNAPSNHPSRTSSPQPVQGAYIREVSARPLGMEIGKASPHVNYEHTFRSDKRHAQQQQRDIVKQQKEAKAQADALSQAAQATQQHALALVRHLSSTPPPHTPNLAPAAAPASGLPAASSGPAAAAGSHVVTGATPPLSPVTPLPGDISGGVGGGVTSAAGRRASASGQALQGGQEQNDDAEVAAAAELFSSSGSGSGSGSGSAAAGHHSSHHHGLGSAASSPSLAGLTGSTSHPHSAHAHAHTASGTAGAGTGLSASGESFTAPSFVSYPGYSLNGSSSSSNHAAAPDTPTRAAAVAAAAAAGAAEAGNAGGIDPAVVASVVANAVAAVMVTDHHSQTHPPCSPSHNSLAAPAGSSAAGSSSTAGAAPASAAGTPAVGPASGGAAAGSGVVLGPGAGSDVDVGSLTEAITRSLLSAAGHELPPGPVMTPLTGAAAPADCHGLPPLPRSATPTPSTTSAAGASHTTTAGGSAAGAGTGASGVFPFPAPSAPAPASASASDVAAAAAAAASAAAAAAAAASASSAAPAGAAAGAATPPLSAAQHQQQQQLQQRRPVVVLKIGSSSISGADGRLSLNMVSSFVELVCDLRRDGYDVIICTSGAVSVGCQRLGIRERPKNVVTKQAIAAVGQGRLMRLYDDLFSLLGQPIAQVLLSRENLAQEHHYLNSLNTFKELLRLGIVPIVNENDTVAVQELRFGDNDTLSALVAAIVQANWLFLLTDVDALYTSNPRVDPTARAVRVVPDVNSLSVDTGDANPLSGKWGTGGMATKLQAASIATSAGVRTAVCSTERLGDVRRMLQGYTDVGTQFVPSPVLLAGRKKWIALGLVPVGNLVLDEGAATSIIKKRSLFAVGITAVAGRFPANSAVRLVSPTGKELGRGLTMYSSRELGLIKGKHSDQYAVALGYNGPAAVVHRENLALFPSAYSYAEEVMRAGGPRSAQAAAISAAAAKGKRHLKFAVPEPGSESDDSAYHSGAAAGAGAGAPAPTVTSAVPGGGNSGMRRSHSSTSVAAAITGAGAAGTGAGGAAAAAAAGAYEGKERSASPAYLGALAGGVEVVNRPDSAMSTASFAK